MSSDGRRITFRQSDPGGAQNGTMTRTPENCNSTSLNGRYSLSISGSRIDVETARNAGSVSLKGSLDADGAGELAFSPDAGPTASAGTYEFEDGCVLHLILNLPVAGDQPTQMNFRGFVNDSGTAVFGMQTDPGSQVSLRLSR